MKYKFLVIAIFIVLLLSVGCRNNSKGVSFTEIVQDEVAKITMRQSVDGALYSTTDTELINQFVSAVKSDVYYGGGDPKSIVGVSTIKLYNANDKEIAQIVFEGKTAVRINDKSYSLKTDINGIYMKSFYEEFLSDKNIIKE